MLLSEALSSVLLVLVFRALPYVAYLSLQVERSRITRALTLGSYVLLVATLGVHAVGVVGWSVFGLCYYAMCGRLVFWLSRNTSTPSGVDALLLFCLLFVVFLVVPGTLLAAVARGTFLIWGWDLTLKAYSYVLDTNRAPRDVRTCLFFLLVDPSNVFLDRAQPIDSPRVNSFGLVRIATGAASVLIALWVLEPGLLLLLQRPRTPGDSLWPPLLIGCGLLQILSTYSKQTGVASVQIGLMRLCGYRVAERYAQPWRARSPAEFWQRWNIYTTKWVSRYVYFPLSLRVARRYRNAGSAGGQVFGVLAAFLFIGAFHDAYTWFESRVLTLKATGFFLANGLLLLAWELGRRARGRSAGRPSSAVEPGRGPLLERIVFCVLFVVVVSAAF
jgi:hypothetical protein